MKKINRSKGKNTRMTIPIPSLNKNNYYYWYYYKYNVHNNNHRVYYRFTLNLIFIRLQNVNWYCIHRVNTVLKKNKERIINPSTTIIAQICPPISYMILDWCTTHEWCSNFAVLTLDPTLKSCTRKRLIYKRIQS